MSANECASRASLVLSESDSWFISLAVAFKRFVSVATVDMGLRSFVDPYVDFRGSLSFNRFVAFCHVASFRLGRNTI